MSDVCGGDCLVGISEVYFSLITMTRKKHSSSRMTKTYWRNFSRRPKNWRMTTLSSRPQSAPHGCRRTRAVAKITALEEEYARLSARYQSQKENTDIPLNNGEGYNAAMYPRDLMGYGETPPYADWPNGAKIAVQVVLNFEEGGENCILHGDESSEAFCRKSPTPNPSSASVT